MHNRWHPDIAPVVTVAAGRGAHARDVEDGLAGQLTRRARTPTARRSTSVSRIRSPGRSRSRAPSRATCSRSSSSTTRSADFGVTAVIPGFGFLADRFTDPYLVKWEIDDGVARSERAAGRRRAGRDVRRRRRRRAVAGAAGAGFARARSGSADARRARRRSGCRSPPSRRSAADGLRTIPPREIGGNLDIRQLVAGSRLYLPVDVPGRAVLDRRPPLRPGRRRGLRHCDRGRRIGHRRASTSTSDHERRSRFPSYETPARPGRRSFATTGIPVDDADGSDRRRPGGAERDDRLPRGERTGSRPRRPTRSAARSSTSGCRRSSTCPIRSSPRSCRSTSSSDALLP